MVRIQYLGNSDTYSVPDAKGNTVAEFVAYGAPQDVDAATADALVALAQHPSHPHRFVRIGKDEPVAPPLASNEPSPPPHVANDPSLLPPTAQ